MIIPGFNTKHAVIQIFAINFTKYWWKQQMCNVKLLYDNICPATLTQSACSVSGPICILKTSHKPCDNNSHNSPWLMLHRSWFPTSTEMFLAASCTMQTSFTAIGWRLTKFTPDRSEYKELSLFFRDKFGWFHLQSLDGSNVLIFHRFVVQVLRPRPSKLGLGRSKSVTR